MTTIMRKTMKHAPNHPEYFTGIALAIFIVLTACESGQPTGQAPKAGEETALMSPAGSAGRAENDDGVGHYRQGHWDVAAEGFRKAIKTDANLAEAHYNLGLALDKMGKHDEATTHFKKAAELAPDKPAIKDAPILKKHIGM
jgi:Flp pilus assembly protein TadD